MKLNSTFTIVRNLVLLAIFGILTHIFARMFWVVQLFGFNTVETNCRDEQITNDWTHWVCDTTRGTDFFQYTSDSTPILGTHVLGAIAAAIVILVAFVIFVKPHEEEVLAPNHHEDDDGELCSDRACPCVSHRRPQQYLDGHWEYADCKDPNCPCVEHATDVFDTKQGKWTYA